MTMMEPIEALISLEEALKGDHEHAVEGFYLKTSIPTIQVGVILRAIAEIKDKAVVPVEGLKVIEAALSYDSCTTEFEGDLACCGGYLDALYNHCEAYRKAAQGIKK